MPGYRGHLLGGLATALLLGGAAAWLGYFRFQPLTAAVLLAVALLASLFPDVDTDSKGQNLFYGLLVVLDFALMFKGHYRWAAILGFFGMLPAVGRHRGWTHTWWAMLLVPAPLLLLPVIFYHSPLTLPLPFYLAAVLGYLSHLALDRKF